MNIRKADENDAYDIANIHVKTWKTAYAGIIHKEYLDLLSK